MRLNNILSIIPTLLQGEAVGPAIVPLILILSGLTNIFHHTLVLIGLESILNINDFIKKMYFIFDFSTVFVSFIFINLTQILNKHTLLIFIIYNVLVLVHIIIHIKAVIYLFDGKSTFYKMVFECAEQKYEDKTYFMITRYILGTLADILCQIFNVFFICSYLTNHKNKKANFRYLAKKSI